MTTNLQKSDTVPDDVDSFHFRSSKSTARCSVRPSRRPILAVSMVGALASGALLTAQPAAASVSPVAGVAVPAPTTAPPAHVPTAEERSRTAEVSMADVIAKAVPARMPAIAKQLPSRTTTSTQDGPTQRVVGAPPARGTRTTTAAASAAVLGAVWPGAYNANPNRQVGKLFYFDPGLNVTNVCSGTVINTPNKSLVLTAGHCVFKPDPDGNGRVDGNGYYLRDFRFCPGYESGCKLGAWYYRIAATTPSWYYGTGTGRTYDWSDDIAVLLMSPNASGYLANFAGGQGIAFNTPTNQVHTAMGYPAPDNRFIPYYYFDGLDLIYCQGVPSPAVGNTKIWMPCQMTGGSSGGPWLSSVNSTWGGYVTSVNSHKPYGAEYMEGPYFGSAETTLFNSYRSA